MLNDGLINPTSLGETGRFVNCHTANEFGGLEFCRLTFPGRDRQQVSDGFCRISRVKEEYQRARLIFVW